MIFANKAGGRIFFDTTFTRTQAGSVGITRTVRRLQQELDGVMLGTPCVPVAFHTDGFREDVARREQDEPERPAARGSNFVASVLRRLGEGPLRDFAFAVLPLPLLYLAWKVYSTWIFNALSSGLPQVRFRPGDTLLMCDAAWSYRSWVAAAAARRDGAAVVLMVHDLIPLRRPEFCSPLFSLLFRKWLHAMLVCADGVVCNSRATEADVRAYAASEGVPLPPVSHFRLGSDLPASLGQEEVRPALLAFFEADAACFAAIGTVEPRKNYSWLLTTFEELWAQGYDLRLLIAGRPKSESDPEVQRMRKHPQQGRRLMSVFDASDREVAYAYSRARALLFASVAEGFGLPLVEARVRGCPVIAGELPAFVELADAGVIFYPQEDSQALKALLLEHARHDRRGATPPMAAFTWRDSARQCLEAMEYVLQARPDAREASLRQRVAENT